MDTNQKYIIDEYLAGRLDADAAAEFEQNLSSNASLKSEFEFQKQIVEGIRLYRKQQLKSQLSEITVSPYGGMMYTSAGKIAAGIAVSVMVGTGAYFALNQREIMSDDFVKGEEIVIDAPIPDSNFSNQMAWDISENPPFEERTPTDNLSDSKTESGASSESTFAEKPENNKVAESKEDVSTEKNPGNNTFTPSIILPDDVSDIETEEGIVVEPISKDLFEKSKIATEEQVKIEVESSKSNVFAYKYYDSKLTLIGDFSDGPYQILEVIGQGQKDIFLFYAEDYYEISLSSQPKPLRKITNEEKIKELDILKNYK